MPSLNLNIIKSSVKQWDRNESCQNDFQQFQTEIDQAEIWTVDARITIQLFAELIGFSPTFLYLLIYLFGQVLFALTAVRIQDQIAPSM